MVEVSVVVPSRGGALLSEQLDALAAQSYAGSWEIVVVLSEATPAVQDALRRRTGTLPTLTIVEAPHPLNAAAARNLGVVRASGDKLLFCDDDDVVGDGWVEALGGALDDHAAVAGPLDLRTLNPEWVIPSRAHPQQTGLQKWDNPDWLAHAGGGNLGVRRVAFQAVGGFDEGLDAFEDTAFCFALQLNGYALAFVPEAVVHVRMRHTLKAIYRQARNWARASVTLHERFATEMPRPAWLRGLLAWPMLVVRLLRVRGRGDLAGWVYRLGWRVGRLEGSVRHRMPAL